MTPPEWVVAPGLTAYPDAVAEMEARVGAIRAGAAPERIWLVEHPPLYTAGVGARGEHLLDPLRFPVFESGRGGKHTYHGPGQRVAYLMLDLAGREACDLHRFVAAIEAWVIAALATLGIEGGTRAGMTGVWVGSAKIAAIGVRVRRWVSYHGVAINVSPNLAHFGGIVPCGLNLPVTSLAALGVEASMVDMDRALRDALPALLTPLGADRPGAASVPRARSATV